MWYEHIMDIIRTIITEYNHEVKRFLDLPNNTILYCFAFGRTSMMYGPTYLLLYLPQKNFELDTPTLHWATNFVTKELNKYYAEFWIIKIENKEICGVVDGKTILKLCKKGKFYNHSKHKCVSISIANLYVFKTKTVDKSTKEMLEKNKALCHVSE